MKNVFFVLVMFCFINQELICQNNAASEYQYLMDFKFTGIVNPGPDSVFGVQYSFTTSQFGKLSKLFVETDNGQKVLDVKKLKSNDSLEIQTNGTLTYLFFKKYNKEDLPVLIQGEYKNGDKNDLYVLLRNGISQTGRHFKQNERIRVNNFKELRAKR